MVRHTNLCAEVSIPPLVAVRTPITPESIKWVESCNTVPRRYIQPDYGYYYCYADGYNIIYISTCTHDSARAEETTEVSLEEFIEQVKQGYLEWELNQ